MPHLGCASAGRLIIAYTSSRNICLSIQIVHRAYSKLLDNPLEVVI